MSAASEKYTGDKALSRIARLCVEAGLRLTGPRRTIAQVLTDAEDHPSVEEVHRRASQLDNRISLSTVYRTVRLLEENGIIERHDFRDGRRRYEEAPRIHHDHLLDLETGTVIEFRNEAIEALQERIARELGYELVGHRLELYAVPLKSPKPEPDRS
ncbi:MAG: Fur family transcriptional regulator [Hyphomicrobiaceae bacterium]